MVEVESPGQTVTFTYDADDRLVRETQAGLVDAVQEFTCTPEGRLVGVLVGEARAVDGVPVELVEACGVVA